MNNDEVCSILVSMGVLNLHPNTLLEDLLNYITLNLKKMNNNNLVQLMASANYIIKIKKHANLYFLIHEEIIKSKTMFNNKQIAIISKVIKRDGLIIDSPLLKEKF
jgi:hypothetical protein